MLLSKNTNVLSFNELNWRANNNLLVLNGQQIECNSYYTEYNIQTRGLISLRKSMFQ